MKNRILAPALLALLAVAAAAPPALAEEGAPPKAAAADALEEQFYRAYYAENGLRDFGKAGEQYAEVFKSARTAGRNDLAVKALLGRARCMRTMGKADEAKAALAGVIEMDPENEEARAAQEAVPQVGSPESDLEQRISFLVVNGLLGVGESSGTSARELRLLGDRCLPHLERALRGSALGQVEAAATYLASLRTSAASDILIRAMKDPTIVFRSAIAGAVCGPTGDGSIPDGVSNFSVTEVPVLAAAAEFPENEIRERVVSRLFTEGDPLDEAGRALVARLALDPSRSVRVAILGLELTLETTRTIEPALRRALASTDQQERLLAVMRAGKYTVVQGALADALRGLIRDPDPVIRESAFQSMRGLLTEVDLAAMLDPAQPTLVENAANILKGMGPWSPGVALRMREAVERAIRGDFADDSVKSVLDLALVWRDDRSGLIDLYAKTGAPDAGARPSRLGALRQDILQRIRLNIRWDQSPHREQVIALVEEGVEKCRGTQVLEEWVRFWSGMNFPYATRAWLRAALADDPGARRAAYAALIPLVKDRIPNPAESLPYLAADLVSPDRDMRAYALMVAERAPSPALAESLRKLLAGADRGDEREKYLVSLVACAGRSAEDAVRAALADPDLRATALRLLVNDLGFRDRKELDAFVAAGGDPYFVAVLFEKPNPPDRALLSGFVNELPVEKYTTGFVPAAARCVDGKERVALLRNALHCDVHMVRYTAVKLIGDMRVLDLWPDLLPILENGEAGVRAITETSLASLKTYAELKSSFANFGKDEQLAARRDAEALLKSEEPLKRKGAVLALAALGDRAAIPALLKALDDEHLIVREAALAALERLGGKPAEPK